MKPSTEKPLGGCSCLALIAGLLLCSIGAWVLIAEIFKLVWRSFR